MNVTIGMLRAAMKSGVKDGLFKRQVDLETYTHTWESVERMIQAALIEQDQRQESA